MKKILLSLTGVMLMLANGGVEAGTQLNFTTTIIQSCTLSMNSTPLVVDLGKYPTSYFSKSGTESLRKPFGIRVSGCPNSKIALKWSGNTVNGLNNVLAVDGAKGLGIVVYDTDKNVIYTYNQAPDGNAYTTTPPDGVLNFNLTAYYYSYMDNVTAGPANASATVEVTYG